MSNCILYKIKTHLFFLSVFSIICGGCSSIDLPSIEESDLKIRTFKPAIEAVDKNINMIGEKLLLDHDVVMRTRMSAFNSILSALVNHRTDDVQIVFNGNKPWIEEDENILGIRYKNYLNIDGGEINLNLTDFHFNSFTQNKLSANLRIEGIGKISISGKYTGIPASASPDVNLDLNETVEFTINTTDSGSIILKPVPKMINLHIKFYINLLAWKIPWNETQQFALESLIKPMTIPTNIKSSIQFPLLSQSPKEKYQFESKPLFMWNTIVTTSQNVLDWRSDIAFGTR